MASDDQPRILVVDDDPDVLEALEDELSDHYRVTSVDNGHTALGRMADRRFDAIISDVRMPGMNGVDLVRRVHSKDPEMVRILLTGYSDDAALEAAWMPDGVYKLAKPWGVELDIVLRRGIEHQQRLREASAEINAERSARQRAELAIAKLDKMASLGTLAAGVAHEMRTPLTYLRANFTWMKTQLVGLDEIFTLMTKGLFGEPGDRNRAYQRLLERRDTLVGKNPVSELQTAAIECNLGVDRLIEILESLREYAAPKAQRPKPVDIQRCIEHAIRMVSCRFKHNVEFRISAVDKVGVVMGNEGELSQVLINLVVNGIQAMGNQGRIDLRVMRGDNSVLVEVEDEGPGVPPEVVPRLFDTFFTTKADQDGTGLGLAISSEIARRHGGELRYEQREGRGAVFVLVLPDASKKSDGEAVATQQSAMGDGRDAGAQDESSWHEVVDVNAGVES